MTQELPEPTLQMPPQLSTIAPEVDDMYYFIYWISVVFFVAIVGAMLYFMWRYRRRPGVDAKPTGHSTVIEVVWTFSPLILLVVLFHEGFVGYVRGAVAPQDSLQVHVQARQWAWDFSYGATAGDPNTLVVPEQEPVELIMSAKDVLHSFFIPTMRVKRDVVPGMYTTLWFEATQQTPERECTGDLDCGPGMHCGMALELPEGVSFRQKLSMSDDELAAVASRPTRAVRYCAATVFCTEYCGSAAGATDNRNSNHSTMLADLHIVSRAQYDRYVQIKRLESLRPPPQCASAPDPMVCWGEILRAQFSCNTCHSIDGSAATGPSWKGLWGSERQFTNSGPTTADLNYIRQSILQPQSQIVAGPYGNMPNFNLEDPQIEALAAYIRSIE